MAWQTKKLSCGCEHQVWVEDGKITKIEVNDHVNLQCPKMWSLFQKGLTWGVFQLETPLGQSQSEKFSPRNELELACLLAVIRPGCMDAIVDDKSVTKHIHDRRHGREPVTYMHPEVKEITTEGEGFIVYQEQAMQIARKLAGFTGEEAETLRRAAGKKLPELMAEMKIKFMEGCSANPNVTPKEAEELFSGIEASQRYAFNKSHSVGYALNSIVYSAYIKSHFPKAFFSAKLKFCKDNVKVGIALKDAKKMGVKIFTPNITHFNSDPVIKNGGILFPLDKVKSVSRDHIERIKQNTSEDFDVYQWLFKGFDSVHKRAAEHLIKCGALDSIHSNRARMLALFQTYRGITSKPLQEAVKESSDPVETITQILLDGTGKGKVLKSAASVHNAEKTLKLFKIAEEEKQSIAMTAKWEKEILGGEMTFTELDDENLFGCISCNDLYEGRGLSKDMCLPMIISRFNEYETKTGNIMCFIEGYDISGSATIVAYSEVYDKFKGLIFEGNKVIMKGSFNHKKKSFQLREVVQL